MLKRKFQLSGAIKALRTRLKNKQMRGSLKGLANSLRSERGESIMEVVVSILIFSILMTTALAVVRTSLIITGNRIFEATESQENVNSFIVNDDRLTRLGGIITFTFTDIDGYEVESYHDIVLSPVGDILVFRPPSPPHEVDP